LFSSASLAVDVSTSKMPPQQPDRLLDLFNKAFNFGAHIVPDPAGKARCRHARPGCSGARGKAQSAWATDG